MAAIEHKTNLNVRDALSYLDRVKVTFTDQTEVYDRFLTIMKEFKSQGIDTPGVIDRVSTLFRGHPVLIQGFNTFLPPGYRIECSIDTSGNGAGGAGQGAGGGSDITTITVTTPMGMTTRTQLTGQQAVQAVEQTQPLGATPAAGAATPAEQPKQEQEQQQQQSSAAQGSNLHLPSLPPTPAVTSMQASAASTPIATPGAVSLLSNHMAPSSSAQGAAAIAAPAQAHAPPQPAGPAGAAAGGDAARPPMEFNHAINYVNKIKNRFLREPETYKAFLEILQTYQKEGRAIQDVYAQVTTLFRDAPDLLDEFKQFLPDTSAGATAPPPAPAPAAPAARGAAKRAAPGPAKRGAAGEEGATAGKRAKTAAKAGEKAGPGKGKRKADAPRQDSSQGRGAKGASPADPHALYHSDSPSVQGDHQYAAAAAQAAAAAHQHAYYGTVPPPQHYGPPPQYAYEPPLPPPPPQPLLAPKPVASAPDLAFFQRVKAHTKDQSTYFEFLKLCNLYTQDLIDLTALVARAWLFLNQDEKLWEEFRDLVGWTEGEAVGDPGKRIEVVDGKRVVENVPRMDGEGWRKSRLDAGKGWQTYGPSYRKLPKEEISLSCSGRDALCWEVLNDEWVSQPSFASDEGFIANRKNPYDEALHRSEEERHEYDYHIEANLRTIALLEPIAGRIAIMDPEERAVFRLKPGLGNQSKSIYQRVLKKVYGKEQGLEVIQALHENPCVAVPIVLARLKQKDEEWKRALREWNRVWRESDAKNFWKSLDHQAISLKANDKRFLTAKALVSEIESLKREQNQRASGSGRPAIPPSFQLSYEVADRRALFDAAKLVFSFLDRSHLVNYADKPKVDAVLRDVLALTFAISPAEFAHELTAAAADADHESNVDGASEAGGSTALGMQGLDEAVEAALASSAGAGGTRKGKKGGDLRKKALRKTVGGEGKGTRGRGAAAAAAAAAAEGSRSKVSSPAPSSRGASPAPSAGGNGDADSVMADLATPAPEGAESADVAPSREASVDGSSVVGDAGDAATAQSAAGETPEPAAGSTTPADEAAATPAAAADLPEIILPVDDKPAQLDERRTWNFFSNSTVYVLLRMFQTLYHRLTLLRNSAVTLALPPPPQPITPTHVPSLSLSLSLAPATGERWTATAEYYYQRALALCEKLFDGELDQPAFEDAIRKILATQGYMLFTVDRLVTGIVKQAQAAVSDSKTRDLLDLLRQDRAHPDRSTHQQQLHYRSQAESVLGSDENLYRIEWVPERRSLAFQLVGKDTVGPEDLPAIEREWAKYVDGYVKFDRTPGLPNEPNMPYLARNLRLGGGGDNASFPPGVSVLSALQSKICMRSYKLFFAADTEDVLVRRREGSTFTPEQVRDRRVMRTSQWMDRRTGELDLLAEQKEREKAEREEKDQVEAEKEKEKAKEAPAAMEVEGEKAEEKKANIGAPVVEEKKDDAPATEAPAPVVEEKKESEDVEMKG
ncbi:hypothetical protein JCM1840_005098 [Sporobolomyces johnsonii]